MKKVQPYLYEPTNEKSLEKANKAIRKKNADFSKLKSPFFKKTNVSSCTCKKCESDAGGCCHFFLNKNNLTESGLAVAKNLLKKFPIFSDNCITDGVEFTEFLSGKNLSIFSLGCTFQNSGFGATTFSNFSNRRKRFSAYAFFAASFYPKLKDSHSIVVTSCVARFVRSLFPSSDVPLVESSISFYTLKDEIDDSDDDVEKKEEGGRSSNFAN